MKMTSQASFHQQTSHKSDVCAALISKVASEQKHKISLTVSFQQMRPEGKYLATTERTTRRSALYAPHNYY